jgi:hypothetical protein
MKSGEFFVKGSICPNWTEQRSWRLMRGGGFPIRRSAGHDPGSAMNEEEVLAEFRAAGALLEGHFILSSGLHCR